MLEEDAIHHPRNPSHPSPATPNWLARSTVIRQDNREVDISGLPGGRGEGGVEYFFSCLRDSLSGNCYEQCE